MGIMNGTLTGGTLFWSRVSAMLGLFILALILGLHRYLIPLHFVLILYRAFLAGFKIMLLIGLYGVTGFFNALFFVLPFETVFFVSLSFVMVCSIDRCLLFGRGRSFRADSEFIGLLIRICPAVAVTLVFCVLEAILIPVLIGTL